MLFVIAKILNLKGYHNLTHFLFFILKAVCDSKDTEFERISQPIAEFLYCLKAVCDSKDTEFERISQLHPAVPHGQRGCL